MFNSEFEKSLPFTFVQGLITIIIYSVGYFLVVPYSIALALQYGLLQQSQVLVVSGFLISIVLITIVLVMKTLSLENIVKWNWSKRIQETLRNLVLIFVALLVTNGVITLVTELNTSENQNIIIEVFRQSPFYIMFLAVVFAPIVEEIVFRGIIYRTLRYLKFKWFAVFVSTFLFGMIHIMNALFMGNFEDTWFILVYMAIGFFMIRIYEHSGDIISPILLHMGYNAIAVLTLYLI